MYTYIQVETYAYKYSFGVRIKHTYYIYIHYIVYIIYIQRIQYISSTIHEHGRCNVARNSQVAAPLKLASKERLSSKHETSQLCWKIYEHPQTGETHGKKT